MEDLTAEVCDKGKEPIRWKLGDMIGEGAFAKVFECINVETGELMAAKQFKSSQDPEKLEKEFTNMRKEIKLLRDLSHPNIVRYYQTDLFKESGEIYLLIEYIQGGSLKALIKKYKSLAESIARNYIRQLLRGLVYLHESGVIHRDLKSANVLVG
jgi:mitogen-activated protein kinase kinase kinase